MFVFLMSFLLFQRAGELVLAEYNRRWARRQGGEEFGQGQYPIIVGMHVLFYLCVALEFRFLAKGWNSFWPFWLTVLLVAQALRVWCIVSLGRFWNTRIIVVPGHKLVTTGPYRVVRHPNYLVVAAEILVIPVLCGAYFTAIFFSVANAIVLIIRIRAEESVLERIGGIRL